MLVLLFMLIGAAVHAVHVDSARKAQRPMAIMLYVA